jgi:hypothetical protein
VPIPLETPEAAAKGGRHSPLSPAEIMDIARARESSLSRLLMAYVSSGLVFMLLPGTFLGVWNLLRISGSESAASVSPAWLQAHGHAQVFGWIGSFIADRWGLNQIAAGEGITFSDRLLSPAFRPAITVSMCGYQPRSLRSSSIPGTIFCLAVPVSPIYRQV